MSGSEWVATVWTSRWELVFAMLIGYASSLMTAYVMHLPAFIGLSFIVGAMIGFPLICLLIAIAVVRMVYHIIP